MLNYCAENEKIAAEYLGVAYLKVPRVILDQLVSESTSVRQQGLLHFVLFASCYYGDSIVVYKGNVVKCFVGDYVGTQAKLAEMSGIHLTTVGHLLRRMVDKKLICMTRIPGGCKIHLYGYAAFTAAREVVLAKAAGKEPKNLGDELEKAKDKLGGRRMNYDDLEN